ncbi:hypothetical protein ACIPZC_23095 [Pseudomonas sp. NPDC089743]|uniref:hypothetical protein n=1 Tax=Pseudomonas sp. NPDC089743 TaxID=3364471 RepID=UPI0037F40013
MLYSAVHLYYNFGVVRRCGAHYTDAPKGCKAPDQKKIQKFNLLIPHAYCRTADMLLGLSKPDISGFNRPMPEFISIYPKVNPF